MAVRRRARDISRSDTNLFRIGVSQLRLSHGRRVREGHRTCQRLIAFFVCYFASSCSVSAHDDMPCGHVATHSHTHNRVLERGMTTRPDMRNSWRMRMTRKHSANSPGHRSSLRVSVEPGVWGACGGIR